MISWALFDHQFPSMRVETDGGPLHYRRAGDCAELTHVLLHGIGSASGSWVQQLRAARDSEEFNLFAWDAPGYGDSQALQCDKPSAKAYAKRLWQGIDRLESMQSPVVLIGHSLGAIVAAAAAKARPEWVSRLILLSPARGYGDAPQNVRNEQLKARLEILHRLGPKVMSQERSAAMLSPRASSSQRRWVENVMSQIQVLGYTQAAHMLSESVLLRELEGVSYQVCVASGEADIITQPKDVKALAHSLQVEWQSLGEVGHACALEAAPAVNALLGLPPSPLWEEGA